MQKGMEIFKKMKKGKVLKILHRIKIIWQKFVSCRSNNTVKHRFDGIGVRDHRNLLITV